MPDFSPPPTLTDLLSKMVSFNTVSAPISGNPLAEIHLANYLAKLAQHHNITTQKLPVEDACHNLLLTVPASVTTQNHILFESHMDTVSIDGMTIDPLNTVIKNNLIFGRGTADTKSSGAAMLTALIDYSKQKTQPQHISLLFTINEETGMTGIKNFVKQNLNNLPIKPTAAIVGEPTQLKPVTAHNGVLCLKLQTQGTAAHSADPTKGHSAITDIIKIIQHLEATYIPSLSATSHPLTGKPQCSINTLIAGSQFNIIPDKATATIDRRVLPIESPEKITQQIQEILNSLKKENPNLNPILTPTSTTAPTLSNQNSHILLAQVQTALKQTNLPTTPIGVPYATDAGHLSQANIPAIVLGPGNIAQAHTKDEFLDLDQLNAAHILYFNIMNTLPA